MDEREEVRMQVQMGAAGRPVIVKQATSVQGRQRLAHEASVLARIDSPHVVALLGFTEHHEGTCLTTTWAGAHTLDTAGAFSLVDVGELLAGAADGVAAMHAAGLVHRRLTTDHIVVGEAGAVVCGVADAIDGPDAAAEDIAALGRILHLMLVGRGDAGEPIPDQRRWARPRWDGYPRSALLNIADHATADDPRARPTARAFAEAVRAATVLAAPRARATSKAPRVAMRVQLRGLGAAVAVVASTWVAWTGLSDLASAASRSESRRTPTPPSATATVPAATAPPTAMAGPAPHPARHAPARPADRPQRCPATRADEQATGDLDGDGCQEPVRVHGGTVSVAGRTFRLGAEEDSVAVGDWDCDGRATAALLRRATGEIFVFERWADRGQPITATPVSTARSAVRLDVRPHDEGCPTLEAVAADGRRTAIAITQGRD